MTPRVKRKILITDAKVPLLWLRNKDLRTQPYVQTRVHSICKQFRPDEMYYIKSKQNPADLGTKFDRFHVTYEEIGDDSLFRKGPACLAHGIEEAVKTRNLIPINSISPSQEEMDLAALEIMKLHQLVLTQDRNELLKKTITPAEALDDNSMEEAVACLIATTNETIENESWLGSKRSTFRVQKATLSVKDRVSKVGEFSNYLISPMR